MGDFNNDTTTLGSTFGWSGWILFNLLGMVSPNDVFQAFSFAAAGLSALAVGVYHVAKTIKLWKDGREDIEPEDNTE